MQSLKVKRSKLNVLSSDRKSVALAMILLTYCRNVKRVLVRAFCVPRAAGQGRAGIQIHTALACALTGRKLAVGELHIIYFAVTLVGVAARGSWYASSTENVFACGMHRK